MLRVSFGRRSGLDVAVGLGSKLIRVRLDIFGFFIALVLLAACSLFSGACTSCLGWIYSPSLLRGP